MAQQPKKTRAEKLRTAWRPWAHWIRHHVPPGARTLLGLVLILGGVFGFLPVLGFWMIPLGIAVIAMDIEPLVDAWRRRRDKASPHDTDEDFR
ncbi:hypothetical protein AADZ90_008620 [Aestuariibius sp. 2305UL40-4]|uniref:hypothetical protein n=1 Tax=Aestuariibius violaceus TaxID=3234132 RepID=UPI00345E9822